MNGRIHINLCNVCNCLIYWHRLAKWTRFELSIELVHNYMAASSSFNINVLSSNLYNFIKRSSGVKSKGLSRARSYTVHNHTIAKAHLMQCYNFYGKPNHKVCVCLPTLLRCDFVGYLTLSCKQIIKCFG